MLKLIIGRAKTGKTYRLLQQVVASDKHTMASRIVIVPEQLSHQMERKLAGTCGNEISYLSEVLSFTRLAHRLAGIYGGAAITALDDAGRILTMRLALSSLKEQLKAFAPVAEKSEFLQFMVTMVDRLKSGVVTTEKLQEVACSTDGAFSQKLSEAAMILSAYNAAVTQGTADPRDSLMIAARQLSETDYAVSRDFFIDGFSDFTALEMSLIEAIMKKCDNLTVSVLCDDLAGGDTLFQDGRNTCTQLLKLAQRYRIPVELEYTEYARDCAPAISWLERNFMQPVPEIFPESTDEIVFSEENSILQECRSCAAFLREKAMLGIRWRDMFIATGNPSQYAGLLKQACTELQIPLAFTEKRLLSSFQCVHFVETALKAVVEGMKTDQVLAWLKCGYSGVTMDDVDLLENYAVVWSIRGEGWGREWTMHPDGYDGIFTESTSAFLKYLNSVRQKAVTPLLTLRQKLKMASDVREQAVALYDFMDATGLFRQIENQLVSETEQGNHEEAQLLSQAWEVMISALTQIVAVLGRLPEKPEEFYQIIRMTFAQYQIGAIPSVLDSVSFGNIASVRGCEPEVLCVLGINDGSIPSYTSDNSVFSEHEIAVLKEEFELELAPDTMQLLQRQLLQLYSAATAPRKVLYLSFHDQEGGSQVQPSFVYRHLKETFPSAHYNIQAEYSFTLQKAVKAYLLDQENGAVRNAVQLASAHIPEIQNMISDVQKHILPRDLAIKEQQTKALFGAPVILSASKLDALNICPMQFFLNYGLNLSPRKETAFNAAEFGTMIHHVLETVVPAISRCSGKERISDATIHDLAYETMQSYKNSRFDQNVLTSREEYLFDRNITETDLILRDIADELQVSDFIPAAYELKFGDGPIPAMMLRGTSGTGLLKGTVDRIDFWQRSGQTFFRIIDYKSGTKSFDYTDIYGGVGLQLILYMHQFGREKFAQDIGLDKAAQSAGICYNSEVITPAGLLYLPANQKIRTSDGPTEERTGPVATKRSGVVLADQEVLEAMEHGATMPGSRDKNAKKYLPISIKKGGLGDYALNTVQFRMLGQFVEKQACSAVDRILSGDFPAQPFYRGENKRNPCSICEYTDICQLEQGTEQRFYRPGLTSKAFWQLLQTQCEDDTGE